MPVTRSFTNPVFLGTFRTHGTAESGAQVADTAAQATTSATQVTPFGFDTGAQADAIATHLNDIRMCLRNHGLMA